MHREAIRDDGGNNHRNALSTHSARPGQLASIARVTALPGRAFFGVGVHNLLARSNKKAGPEGPAFLLERARRFERPTLTLARLCSTPELRPRSVPVATPAGAA